MKFLQSSASYRMAFQEACLGWEVQKAVLASAFASPFICHDNLLASTSYVFCPKTTGLNTKPQNAQLMASLLPGGGGGMDPARNQRSGAHNIARSEHGSCR